MSPPNSLSAASSLKAPRAPWNATLGFWMLTRFRTLFGVRRLVAAFVLLLIHRPVPQKRYVRKERTKRRQVAALQGGSWGTRRCFKSTRLNSSRLADDASKELADRVFVQRSIIQCF